MKLYGIEAGVTLVKLTTVEAYAADLMSEDGENVEYDRALIELVATLNGLPPMDYREDVEAYLRGEKDNLWQQLIDDLPRPGRHTR